MDYTEIQLAGIDHHARPGAYTHVYGVRRNDTANRLVGVAIPQKAAFEIMEEAKLLGTMPSIEVPSNTYFYVAVLGADVSFEEGKLPS